MLSRKKALVLMMVPIIVWGLDYSVAKNALTLLPPLSIVFCKYGIGVVVLGILKLLVDRKFEIRKSDILLFIACGFVGQVLYYTFEYTAMNYMPVSLITIMLSLVPVVSVLIERVFFHRKLDAKIMIGLLIGTVGIVLVIGSDFRILLQGRALGYILALGAILCWNGYNYMTVKVTSHYSALTAAFNQQVCTALMTFPYAVTHLPKASDVTPSIAIGLIYLGAISAGVSYWILMKCMRTLGPTIPAMYNNFLPVFATFFGWLLLHESISPMQIVGGIIVVGASGIVIMEKSRLDAWRSREERRGNSC